MKKDLHIIIFCKTFLKGGAEKQALILARLFSENEYNVTLVNWRKDRIDSDNRAFIENCPVQYVGLAGTPVKKIRSLLKITRKYERPVILSYLSLANLVAGILRVLNKDLITIGGIRSEQLPYQKLIFERVVHNHINSVTVFNNYSAKSKFVGRGFNPDKIRVIHNAIEVPQFSKPSGRGDLITIITVSRFVKSKDFYTALHAYKSLVQNSPGKIIRYRIVGYGYHETAIRTLVNTLDLVSNVELLIRPRDIYSILKDADIYLSTSIYEGLSNSIMEAMAASLPVVATDVGDNRYLVQDNFNGYLVKSRDTDAIVRKLQYLVENDSLREKFGNNSYHKVSGEFSEQKLFNNYIGLLTDLTGSNEVR
ncbi:MAG: glycosyltransferase [Bacteroidales bacterium]|nr:glycosyltransferase [Bacteroidales bacterium]